MSDDKNLQGGHNPSDENNDDDFTPKTQDEIRQGVIGDMDLDDEIDNELIDKLVAKEELNQKSLSTAIKQKIKVRDELKGVNQKLEEVGGHFKPAEEPTPEPKKDLDIDAELDKRFEQRDLKSMDVSDDIKKEIETYAKTNGVTVKEAHDSSYIKFRINEESEQSRNENASLKGGGSGYGKKDLSNATPDDFKDMTDEQFAEWKRGNLK